MRNGASTIREQLDAVLRQRCSAPWELVVVDNGSTDGTATVLDEACARDRRARLVHEPRMGANVARNAGLRAARGSLLCFCDADDVVQPGWLAAYHEASCQSRPAIYAGALDVEVPGSAPHHFELAAERAEPIRYLGFLPVITGANFAVDREVLEAIGGFDESYSQGGDDTELGWRAQLYGYRLVYVPHAVVRYRERATLREVWAQRRRYGESHPHLFRDYRAAGMRRRPLRRVARSYGHLVVRLPRYLRTATGRREWVALAAVMWGRVRGSIRYRTLYL